ncbi:MAG: aminotransferase class I/II-fold pyridoxal phosphate-dependent enzyme [Saprospiraceae bacterium]|nr:aminotransferase class I/II-fold pyridoxal phosphate-dependent enzyme [Saprospiraceae bacterium]
MHQSEILTHLGEEREKYFQAVSPPVIQTSNFCFSDLKNFRKAFQNELENHIYSRGNNPTVKILRAKLAALEGTEDALVFSSGSGAIAAAVIAQVQAGDHIVCVESPYSWTHALLTQFLARFGVTHTFVDGRDIAAIEEAIQDNTKVLYLESPSSLTFNLQDLKACAQLAQKYGLVSLIDNSFASPIFQQPAKLGIDLVLHSGTKYINGHSDVVCGVVCGSKEKIFEIFNSEQMTLGSILPPHDAAMVIRGLRTLPLRMERVATSALIIAQYLEEHPKVKQVIHPMLPSFPQYDLAQEQMSGAGGLFSVYIKAETLALMETFIHSLKRFLIAVSWGGHESLIMPVAGFYGIEGREDSELPWNLVRFSIGLEDPAWLIEDIEQALDKL